MKKKAIGYVRISDDEQSHNSIEGQTRHIQQYAERKEMELLEIFVDDGQSAKDFDRKSWKALERFIVDHYPAVQALIVINYDRFSRNTAEGLVKITMLEKKYHIIILSVFQEMMVDMDSPYFFKHRADMLVQAEFEWHVIRDRTRFGMHQGMLNGRFLGKAPKGYMNAKDEKGKPILLQDPRHVDTIRFVFRSFLNGWNIVSIRKAANAMGLAAQGKSTIQGILSNPVYAGLIRVPAYRKEPEKIVPGLHEAIIEQATWQQVQARLKHPGKERTSYTEEAPLRGTLRCGHCQRPMTAGASKGKKKYYWYYRCDSHTGINLNAGKLHDQLLRILEVLSLPKHYLEAMHTMARQKYAERLEQITQRKQQLETLLKATLQKMENLEDKLLEGILSPETYTRQHTKLGAERATAEQEYEALGKNVEDKWALFDKHLPYLGDIRYLYEKALVPMKQKLINLVFNGGLSYREDAYRTPSVHTLFASQLALAVDLGLLEVQQKSHQMADGLESSPFRT